MFLVGIGLYFSCRYSSSILEILHYGRDIMSLYFLPIGDHSLYVHDVCKFLGDLEYSIHPCILFSSLFLEEGFSHEVFSLSPLMRY